MCRFMTENGVFIKKEGRIYRTIVSNRNIWEDFSVKTTMQKTLRALGIARNYDGYRLIPAAVQLSVEDEDRLRLAPKRYTAGIHSLLLSAGKC